MARAEIEGEVGDMILNYEDGIIVPPGLRVPSRHRPGVRVARNLGLAGAAFFVGVAYHHNVSLAVLLVGVGVVLAVAVLDRS